MKRTTPIIEDDDRFAAVAAPPLSDEAVYIHRALETHPHLFETQYCAQMRRYYRERERDNITTSSTRPVLDDEPF